MGEVFLDNISFNDGIIYWGLNSEVTIDKVRLDKSNFKIDYKNNNNTININELIKNNYFTLLISPGLYHVKFLTKDNEELCGYLKGTKVSGKEYLCQGYECLINNNIVNVDIYINDNNEVKILISTLTQNNISFNMKNIYYNEEKLYVSLSKKNTEEENFEINTAKAIVVGNTNQEVLEVLAQEITDDKIKFIFDINTISKNNNNNSAISFFVNDKLVESTIDKSIKFKKIKINDKFVEIKINNKDNITIETINKFKIAPIIEKVYYKTGLGLKGSINCNVDIYNEENIKCIIKLQSRDGNNSLEYLPYIDNDNFEILLPETEIEKIKYLYNGIWDIYFVIKKDEEILQEKKFIRNSGEKTYSKKIILFKDIINLELYKTKSKEKYQAIRLTSKVSILKIMYVLKKGNKVELKLRTKDKVDHLLASSKFTISLVHNNKENRAISMKKIGKKTFTAIFNIKYEEFLKEYKHDGIKLVANFENEKYLSNIKDIDKDNIHNSYKSRVQRTKKYKKICSKLYNKVFLKMPIKKNRIMFESFLGRNISGNPKYIYTHLVEKGLDKNYELIWILNNPTEKVEGKHKTVKRKTLKYYYYMATSKYWFANCRQADDIIKRNQTVYCQTWHGTPLKKLGNDLDSVSMAGQTSADGYKEQFYKNSRRWDYLIAQNTYSAEIFKRAFSFDKKMLDYGYPANDILYNKNNNKDIIQIKEKLNIPKDKKIILYAPTWRDNNFYKKGHYKMEIQLELDKMQRELGDEYIVLLRMHYLITNNINIEKYNGFVLNYSEGYDIQELYLVSDILITDYSSVMFDYANLDRQMIFYTYDLELYRDSLRGFYFDFVEEAPGPLAMNTDDVINAIKNLKDTQNIYRDRFDKFREKYCHIDDGKAAERVLKEVMKI